MHKKTAPGKGGAVPWKNISASLRWHYPDQVLRVPQNFGVLSLH
jgi:hypothetical protein